MRILAYSQAVRKRQAAFCFGVCDMLTLRQTDSIVHNTLLVFKGFEIERREEGTNIFYDVHDSHESGKRFLGTYRVWEWHDGGGRSQWIPLDTNDSEILKLRHGVWEAIMAIAVPANQLTEHDSAQPVDGNALLAQEMRIARLAKQKDRMLRSHGFTLFPDKHVNAPKVDAAQVGAENEALPRCPKKGTKKHNDWKAAWRKVKGGWHGGSNYQQLAQLAHVSEETIADIVKAGDAGLLE